MEEVEGGGERQGWGGKERGEGKRDGISGKKKKKKEVFFFFQAEDGIRDKGM